MTDELFIRSFHAPAGFIQPHLPAGLPPNTPMLVGFSGGADSRLLLELSLRCRDLYGAPVYAAHLHHGIRGAEADRDQEFCEEVAADLGVRLFTERADIPAMAEASGRSLESQARAVRYAFFQRLMETHGIPILLTAHHADDQLETLLLRLLRGSGTRGMGGIPPVRKLDYGVAVRPLLQCTRGDILTACASLGLTYVTDSTNLMDDATRNRIRHHVLPALESVAGEGIPQDAAGRLSRAAAEDDDCLTALAAAQTDSCKAAHGGWSLESLTALHPAVAKRILNEAYTAAVMTHCGMTDEKSTLAAVHLEHLMTLCRKGNGDIDLPAGIRATLSQGILYFLPKKELSPTLPTVPTRLPVGETPWDGGRMVIRVEESATPLPLATDERVISSALFPKTVLPLWARQRAEGDVILNHGMHKKLKKLLCDKKVPEPLRDRLPLICTGDDKIPLWYPTAAFADGYPPPQAGPVVRITITVATTYSK